MNPQEVLTRDCWDVVVVGAGPAGSLAAYRLAKQGASVLLVDRAEFPRYKVCGCCLNPRTQAMLKQIGLGHLLSESESISEFRAASSRHNLHVSLDGWSVLSRERIDTQLAFAACQAGATFLMKTTAQLGPVTSDGRTCVLYSNNVEKQIVAAVVLAADGLSSQLLTRDVPDSVRVMPGARIGAGTIVDNMSSAYEPHCIYMACGTGGYVGIVRLEDGRLNIAAAFDSSFVRECRGPGVAACRILNEVGWERIPGLADQFWKGTTSLTRTLRYPAGQRVLAIGDAAGYVEPFTGEGISWAVESAIRVTRLLKNSWYPNLPLRWARWNRNESIQRRRLIRSVAWVLRRPQLTAVSINLLNLFPSITGRLIKQLFNPDSIVLPPLSGRAQTPAPRTAAVSCI